MKKHFIFVISVLPFLVAAAPKTPQGGIVRPKTNVVVTHPTTSGVSTVRPVTQVTVSRPQSADVVVSHPSTAEAEAAVTQGATDVAPSAGAKGAGNTIPSGSSPTSMSNFKGKQAADLKAAQHGQTSLNLATGKEDSAKDSTAKNSNAFKGVGGDLEKQMAQANAGVSKSSIAGKVAKSTGEQISGKKGKK